MSNRAASLLGHICVLKCKNPFKLCQLDNTRPPRVTAGRLQEGPLAQRLDFCPERRQPSLCRRSFFRKMQINTSKIQPHAPPLDATLILNFRGKEHESGSAYFLEVLIPGVYLLYLLCLSLYSGLISAPPYLSLT